MGAKVVLQSWKEISAFVGRTERTLQRWEQQFGFPVHRPSSKLRSSVMALSEEIQEWTREKPSLVSLRKDTRLVSAKASGEPRSERTPGNLQVHSSLDTPAQHRTRLLESSQRFETTMMRIQCSHSLWEKQRDLRGDVLHLLQTQLKLHEELQQHLDVFRAPNEHRTRKV